MSGTCVPQRPCCGCTVPVVYSGILLICAPGLRLPLALTQRTLCPGYPHVRVTTTTTTPPSRAPHGAWLLLRHRVTVPCRGGSQGGPDPHLTTWNLTLMLYQRPCCYFTIYLMTTITISEALRFCCKLLVMYTLYSSPVFFLDQTRDVGR